MPDTRSPVATEPSFPVAEATPHAHGGRPWAWAGVLLVIAVAAAAWWQHQRTEATAAGTGTTGHAAAGGTPGGRGGAGAAASRAQPVSVAAVQRRDIGVGVDVIGSVAATNTAVVRTKVSGELKAILYREGQPVRAGQVLAEIDPRSFRIAVDGAQATLARDQAQLRNAQLDLERYQGLVAKDAAPKQQQDTQDALVQQLKATLLADQAALDAAKLQLSYTRVVAPIAGLAGLKQADLGNVVNPSDVNGLVSIAQMQPAAVVFAVPDARLQRIREQLRAGAVLPVEVWDSANTRRLDIGKVASTDNAIDSATGTIRVKALFPNPDNRLFANQFVNVRLQLDKLVGVLAVPSAALQRGAPGTFVYAVAGDGSVTLKVVGVLATEGDWVAVTGDLVAGESVVVDGTDRLRDGAQVEVIAPAASAPASPRRDPRRASQASTAGAASAPASQPPRRGAGSGTS